METFHGYDFETMTETAAPAASGTALPVVDRQPLESDGDLSFVRGLFYGLLFTIPCWVVLAGAMLAVIG
jgi:hypothetical protein